MTETRLTPAEERQLRVLVRHAASVTRHLLLVREAVKQELGDRYEWRVEICKRMVRGRMGRSACNPVEAAMAIIERTPMIAEQLQALLLAAAVEISTGQG